MPRLQFRPDHRFDRQQVLFDRTATASYSSNNTTIVMGNSVLNRRSLLAIGLSALAGIALAAAPLAAAPSEIRIDFATYNPVSLVLKEQKILEKAFEKDGITIRWVQSLGLEQGAGIPQRLLPRFRFHRRRRRADRQDQRQPDKVDLRLFRPEWTALVTRKDTGIAKVAELKGKRVAVTRGTDPHIFLVRALAEAGLTEKDVKLVLFQHADGRLALERGDVDAWAGLDPMMAASEIESGAGLVLPQARGEYLGHSQCARGLRQGKS